MVSFCFALLSFIIVLALAQHEPAQPSRYAAPPPEPEPEPVAQPPPAPSGGDGKRYIALYDYTAADDDEVMLLIVGRYIL